LSFCFAPAKNISKCTNVLFLFVYSENNIDFVFSVVYNL